MKTPISTPFLIIPRVHRAENFPSSKVTLDTFRKVFKPADCALRINRISLARNNGISTDAISPNIEKIKSHSKLVGAEFEVMENVKIDPKLIALWCPDTHDV